MAFELNGCMSAYVMLQYLIPIMSQVNMRAVIQIILLEQTFIVSKQKCMQSHEFKYTLTKHGFFFRD